MKLGRGVHLVRTRVGQSLLLEGPPLTLIDTGRPGSVARVGRALRKVGRRIEDLDQIVITHAHHDHIGSAAELKELSGAAVLIHHADRDVATGESPPYPLRRKGKAALLVSPAWKKLERFLHFPTVEVDGDLDDGDEIDPGIRVIATPGHTPGHVSILIASAELLHVGDAVWNVVGLTLPPTMVNTDDLAARESLSRLADLGFRRATFGHGPPLMRGARKKVRRAARRSGI